LYVALLIAVSRSYRGLVVRWINTIRIAFHRRTRTAIIAGVDAAVAVSCSLCAALAMTPILLIVVPILLAGAAFAVTAQIVSVGH
jgi:hypothetical protein